MLGEKDMNTRMLLIIASWLLMIPVQAQDHWITILVHGALGLGAHLSGQTIHHIKNDCIEGSPYERNALAVRENPYVIALSPTGKLGLNPVKKEDLVTAAYAFSELYTVVAEQYLAPEKNSFYTYGWSGLMSEKRRKAEAREFYCALRKLIQEQTKNGTPPKVRLIGYSYGPNMFLHFATLRKQEFPHDSFIIDEAIFVGTPVNKTLLPLIQQPPFKKIYHVYSGGDSLQRLDLFSTTHTISHRTFKGRFPQLTQIELKITGQVRRKPNQVLPSALRRKTNLSPGHVELWSFGWSENYYRKNLPFYPLCAAVFIPFLIHAAHGCTSTHIKVDLRLDEGCARIHSHMCHETITIPFLSPEELNQLTEKARSFDPTNEQNKKAFAGHTNIMSAYR